LHSKVNHLPPPEAVVDDSMLMNNINIAEAEEIIGRYVHEKNGWDKSDFGVYIHSKKPVDYIVEFTILHKDDHNPTSLGGGKSFLVVFDMIKKSIVRELRFQ
jgi:hypothetical protein